MRAGRGDSGGPGTGAALPMVINYLEEQRRARPDLAEWYDSFSNLYRHELWSELILKVDEFFKIDAIQTDGTIIKVYDNIIANIETKISQLQLAQFAVTASRQYPDIDTAIAFLNGVILKLCQTKDLQINESIVYVKLRIAEMNLEKRNRDECKFLLQQGKNYLLSLTDVDPSVHAYFYWISCQYNKATEEFSDFYTNALHYLRYTNMDCLSESFKQVLAFDLSTSALLSNNIFSFEELVSHPIINSLIGSSLEWVYNLVYAFSTGNQDWYEEIVRNSDFLAQPNLVENEWKLYEKISFLGVVKILLSFPNENKIIKLDFIAEKTKLSVNYVERLLKKSISVRLVHGKMDVVDRTVHIFSINPKVYVTPQVEALREACHDPAQEKIKPRIGVHMMISCLRHCCPHRGLSDEEKANCSGGGGNIVRAREADSRPEDIENELISVKNGRVAPWRTANLLLNIWICIVSGPELIGNFLGLALNWWSGAVIIGSYASDLGSDTGYSTLLFFVEAFRIAAREMIPLYQIFFKITGGVRTKRIDLLYDAPHYFNVGVTMLCCYIGLEASLGFYGSFFYDTKYRLFTLAALIGFAALIRFPIIIDSVKNDSFMRFLPLFGVLLIAVTAILCKVSWALALLFASSLGMVCVFCNIWRRLICYIPIHHVTSFRVLFCIICPLLITLGTYPLIGFDGILLLVGSTVAGNMQVPCALLRVVVSIMRMKAIHHDHESKNTHVVRALHAFYFLVAVQGSLFLLSCALDLVSRTFRYALAKRMNAFNKRGVSAVDEYYEDAVLKCSTEGVFKWDLISYCIASLQSNNTEKKLSALLMLYHHLEVGVQGCLAKVIMSPNIVPIITDLIDCPADVDDFVTIRSLAAKVFKMICNDIHICHISGANAVMKVTKLLKSSPAVTQRKTVKRNETDDLWKKFIHHVLNHVNLLPPENGGEAYEVDSFPLLGLQILDVLGRNSPECFDANRSEIIGDVVGILNKSLLEGCMTEIGQKLICTALSLLGSLACVENQLGSDFRLSIIAHPLLLGCLCELLYNTRNRFKLKDTAQLICNLAMEDTIFVDHMGPSIPKIMCIFLDENEFDWAAAEILSYLTHGSVENCQLMLDQGGRGLVIKLLNALWNSNYICTSTFILQNLVCHCSDKLSSSIPMEQFHSSVQLVLNLVLESDDQQELESIIALLPCLFKINPRAFVADLINMNSVDKLLAKMVQILNDNVYPSLEYPQSRRHCMEFLMCLVEAEHFHGYRTRAIMHGVLDATNRIQERPSTVEDYRIFSGHTGLMKVYGISVKEIIMRINRILTNIDGAAFTAAEDNNIQEERVA